MSLAVLLVTGRFNVDDAGGGEVSVAALALGLRSAGVRVRVLAERLGRPDPDVVVGPVSPSAVARAGRDVDVVHSYNLHAIGAVLEGAHRAGRPAVVTANSYRATCLWADQTWPDGEPCPRCTLAGLRRDYATRNPRTIGRRVPVPLARLEVWRRTRTLSRYDRVVVLSEASQRVLARDGIPEHKITVIPNMIDPAFAANAPTDRGGGILFVGALKHGKGVATLLAALARLPGAFLDIVGEGPEEEPLRRLAASLDIERRVRFHGRVTHQDLGRFYAQARVFAFPVWWEEPFGRVLLEAWAWGVPVVVSDRGAPAELVDDGRTGLVVPALDSGRLAEALGRVLDQPDFAGRLALAGRERLRDFAPERILPRHLEVYRSLIPTGG